MEWQRSPWLAEQSPPHQCQVHCQLPPIPTAIAPISWLVPALNGTYHPSIPMDCSKKLRKKNILQQLDVQHFPILQCLVCVIKTIIVLKYY